jgi:hypothetical protein
VIGLFTFNDVIIILIALFTARNLGELAYRWLNGTLGTTRLLPTRTIADPETVPVPEEARPVNKQAEIMSTALYCIPFVVALVLSITAKGTPFNTEVFLLIAITLVAGASYLFVLRMRKPAGNKQS